MQDRQPIQTRYSDLPEHFIIKTLLMNNQTEDGYHKTPLSLALAPLNSITKERQAHMETLGRKFTDYVLRMKLERS